MTYDYADGYVLLFGGAQLAGSSVTSYGDTWAFKNDGWSQIVTAQAPSGRAGATMVYDPAEAGVVLFGGTSSFTGFDNDTWLYRAGNWTQLDAAGVAPSGRFGTSIAWDANSRSLIAFGGAVPCPTNCSAQFAGTNDTWAFGNESWTKVTTATAPPATTQFTPELVNVSAASELVLLVDLNVSVAGDCQTWVFRAGAWSELALTPQACGVQDPISAWDSGDNAAIFFGGSPSILAEPTWAFAAGAWNETDNDSYPGPLVSAALAYDPVDGSAYLFGGQSSPYAPINNLTYRFDGSEWHVLNVATGPTPGTDASFTYDPTLGGLVLFGGGNSTQLLNGTWLLRSGAWSEVAGANASPPARFDASAAFDPNLGGLLVYGGANDTSVTLNDTWLLNGSTWSELHPSATPGPRFGAAMTYDVGRSADVLFGGDGVYGGRSSIDGDTWEFQSGTWTQLTTAVAPAPRAVAPFVYDPAAGGDVLFGGLGVSATLGDAWRLTATGWSPLASAPTPAPRAYSTAYFDSARNTVWLFGGLDVLSSVSRYVVLGDLYELDTLTALGSVNTTAGGAPLSVGFSAASSGGDGPVSLVWSFGDNQSSSTANTTHVYERGGNFTARLTATDSLGVSATWAVSISALGVGPEPVYVTASASPDSGPAPLTVNFTASAGGGVAPYTFEWNFGDSVIATRANVSHTYDAVAVFNATVTATDSFGNTASKSFAINATQTPPPPPPPPPPCCPPPPFSFNVSIDASATSGTAPATIQFSANLTENAIAVVNIDYVWNFGDGGTATGGEVTHVFQAGGRFLVSVTASDGVGDTATGETNVTITPAPPSATAPLGGGIPVTDLLVVVGVAALVLVAVTSYLTRSARRRASQKPEGRPGDTAPAPDPASESTKDEAG